MTVKEILHQWYTVYNSTVYSTSLNPCLKRESEKLQEDARLAASRWDKERDTSVTKERAWKELMRERNNTRERVIERERAIEV